MTPAKIRSVAWPRIFGPDAPTAPTLTHAAAPARRRAMPRSGRSWRQQPFAGALEVHRLLGGLAVHHPAAGAAGRSVPGPVRGRGRTVRRSCRLLLGELGEHDLPVGLVAVHQLVVGAGADDPALVEDDDPVGVADGGRPAGRRSRRSPRRSRGQRRAQRRVGRVVERGEGVVEEVDLGPLHQRRGRSPAAAAGRRRRWCRPARSARRARPPCRSTKSRACATSSACHSSSSVASGLP